MYFRRFSQNVIQRKIYKTSTIYKCKNGDWLTRIPPERVEILITLESDYPKEVFGAPKEYVMYLKFGNKVFCLGSGRTIDDLKANVFRWLKNECFKNNVGDFVLDAIHHLS